MKDKKLFHTGKSGTRANTYSEAVRKNVFHNDFESQSNIAFDIAKQHEINAIKAKAYDRFFDYMDKIENRNQITHDDFIQFLQIKHDTIDTLEEECNYEYGRDY